MTTETAADEYTGEIDEARELGRNAGIDAAGWVFDGNTDLATYQAYLAGDDGTFDFDLIPSADLSGEWADGPTPHSLMVDLGLNTGAEPEWLSDAICDAYCYGFDCGVLDELVRVARYHTEEVAK